VAGKKKYRIIRRILLLITIICLIPVGQAYYLSARHEKQQEELSRFLGKETTAGQEAEITDPKTGEPVQEEQEILGKFKNLYAQNSDLTGWLAIEGTDIDYPVMQCEDDAYYLSHSFFREEDKYGCLYVRGIADVNTPGTNIIIYGHNMRDGSMFGNLDEFESEAFCREHTRITFDTLYEERIYEVMAVFRSQVYGKEQDQVFQYYQFYQADTEEQFLYFYENVMKMALYDTGVTAEFGDTFLTLSTCSGHVENGRFVVVAKRVV